MALFYQLSNILIINAIPLFGWAFLGWDLFEIIRVYWLDLAAVFLASIFNMIYQKHEMGVMYIFAGVPLAIVMIFHYLFLSLIVNGFPDKSTEWNSLNSFFESGEAAVIGLLLMFSFLFRNRNQLKIKKGEFVFGIALEQLTMGLAVLPLFLIPLMILRFMFISDDNLATIFIFLCIKFLYDYTSVYSKLNIKNIFKRKNNQRR